VNGTNYKDPSSRYLLQISHMVCLITFSLDSRIPGKQTRCKLNRLLGRLHSVLGVRVSRQFPTRLWDS